MNLMQLVEFIFQIETCVSNFSICAPFRVFQLDIVSLLRVCSWIHYWNFQVEMGSRSIFLSSLIVVLAIRFHIFFSCTTSLERNIRGYPLRSEATKKMRKANGIAKLHKLAEECNIKINMAKLFQLLFIFIIVRWVRALQSLTVRFADFRYCKSAPTVNGN